MPDLKHKEITEKNIRASMKFYAAPGNGFREVIYQRTFEMELQKSGLELAREFNMPFIYKERMIGERKVDFLVQGVISFVFKAILQWRPVHFAQARNYLKASNLEVGLLKNFGSTGPGFKRLQNPKFKPVLKSQ